MMPTHNFSQKRNLKWPERIRLLIALLIISVALPGIISADDAVSSCLQIAAQKIKQGQRIVITATGGMTTRGGLVSLDTAKGTLTVRALGDARAKFAHMTFMESQIAKIETERGWQPLYLIGGVILGVFAGMAVSENIESNNVNEPDGEKIAVFGACVIGGTTLGFIFSITQGQKIVIDCNR